MNKQVIVLLSIIAIVVLVFFYYRSQSNISSSVVNDFVNQKSDLIVVDNPRPNQVVTSPLEISGKARGTWFFEADFPVRLYDVEGKEIAVGIAKAQGEWMTEEFVPFIATLTFETPLADKGELVVEKSNPSDLPENADSLSIPVKFR